MPVKNGCALFESRRVRRCWMRTERHCKRKKERNGTARPDFTLDWVYDVFLSLIDWFANRSTFSVLIFTEVFASEVISFVFISSFLCMNRKNMSLFGVLSRLSCEILRPSGRIWPISQLPRQHSMQLKLCCDFLLRSYFIASTSLSSAPRSRA